MAENPDPTNPAPENPPTENPNPNPVAEHPYGQLNDIRKPSVRKRFSLNPSHTFQAMTEAAADHYTPDAFANVGSFRGLVLRVDTATEQEPGGWWSTFFEGVFAQPPTPLVQIKVCIPELHPYPIPDTLGDTPGPHQKIIDMYPTFVAQSTAVQEPKPGDLVWVDFGNRQDWSDPYYIRPVMEEAMGGVGGTNGWCGAGGSYTPSSNTGDHTEGSNKSVPGHQGLPRLKRVPTPEGKPKLIQTAETDPVPITWWEKESKTLVPGVTWIGNLKSNGPNDPKHKHGKRSTLVWYANTTDFKQEWELIYWFHGLTGFSQKNFKNRMVPQLTKMVEEGRNFVFVKPELPWSYRGTNKTRGARQSGAWRTDIKDTWGGDFVQFHQDILSLPHIKEQGTSPSFISCYGHSNGGSALARAAQEGAFKQVGPSRIFFSDSDYGWGYEGGAQETVWREYVKEQPNVWMTALTINGQTPRKKASKFIKDHVDEIKDRPIYHIETSKSHGWCGENALTIIAEEHLERIKKKEAEEVAKDNATPDDVEESENKTEAEDVKEKEEGQEEGKISFFGVEIPTTPKHQSPKDPPTQTPPQSPSKVSKQSTTESAPPSFKVEPAVEYKSNRVRQKHYGGNIPNADNPLLREVQNIDGKKKYLHVLVAKRWLAMKADMIAAGFDKVKIASAWRQHKWKNYDHYKNYIINKYANHPKVKDGTYKSAYSAGKAFMGFRSPHETGMAIDIVGHGLGTSSKAYYGKKPIFQWLKKNAHKYGFTPYTKEAWHWEVRLPYNSWASGEEFTEDYAVRVTDIGTKDLPLPSGNQTGGGQPMVGQPAGSGGGGGGSAGGSAGAMSQQCVITNASGQTEQVGNYAPGPPFSVTGGSKPKQLVGGPDRFRVKSNGSPRGYCKVVKLFVIHETAGQQHSTPYTNKSSLQRRKPNEGVHFWLGGEGGISQTMPVTMRAAHANKANSFSCGVEVSSMSTNNQYKYYKDLLGHGYHIISPKKDEVRGDIQPVTFCPWSSRVGYVLPHQVQCKSTYDLIAWLINNPPPAEGNYRYGGQSTPSQIKITWQFPCIPDKDGFYWSRWNGGPSRDVNASNNWFKQHEPSGICSHARIHTHTDGIALEYYMWGRVAHQLSHEDAFYGMVGALCSGQKKNGYHWTKGPKHYIKLGRQKFPSSWWNGETRYVVGRKKWKKLAKDHPEWFLAGVKISDEDVPEGIQDENLGDTGEGGSNVAASPASTPTDDTTAAAEALGIKIPFT